MLKRRRRKGIKINVIRSEFHDPTVLGISDEIEVRAIPKEHWEAFWDGMVVPVGPYWVKLKNGQQQ